MQAASKGSDSLKQQADCHLILPYQSLPYKEYLQKLAHPLPFSSTLLCCPVRNIVPTGAAFYYIQGEVKDL